MRKLLSFLVCALLMVSGFSVLIACDKDPDNSLKYVPVFGVDATTGKMVGTIKQDAVGMAKGIVYLARNVQAGKELMDSTIEFNIDDGADKIRIPYAIYTGADSSSESDIPTWSGTAGADKLDVQVFWYTYSDTYLASVRTAMTTEFTALSANFNVTHNDCENDQAKQQSKVETAITAGADLLIVNIVTTGSDQAAQNIIDSAETAGIPIVFFNREVSDASVNSYEDCCFVGTDADEAGYMQGKMIAEFLLKDGNLEKYDVNDNKKIDYVMLRGELGNAEAFGRTKFSVSEANRLLLAANSAYKLVPSKANATDNTQPDDGISPFYLYGNWSAATAKSLMDTALTTHSPSKGDIELIIANNDDQALGAIESLNEIGYNK